MKARFIAIRCWRVDGCGVRRIGWLIGQRPARGQSGDAKYFWSDFPAHASLKRMIEYTHRRHWIEQYHEEAKGELGWDQYQGRLWQGFHRNAVLVMLSYSFLVWLEWHARHTRRLVDRAALFPPRRDRRRRSLASVHSEIVDWLRGAAIRELIPNDLIDQFCPRLN